MNTAEPLNPVLDRAWLHRAVLVVVLAAMLPAVPVLAKGEKGELGTETKEKAAAEAAAGKESAKEEKAAGETGNTSATDEGGKVKEKKAAAVPPTKKPAVRTGSGIYADMCASCHGEDGTGSRRKAAATGMSMASLNVVAAAGIRTQTALAEVISRGRGRMPGFSDRLSKREIHAVVLHLRAIAATSEKVAGKRGKSSGPQKATTGSGARSADQAVPAGATAPRTGLLPRGDRAWEKTFDGENAETESIEPAGPEGAEEAGAVESVAVASSDRPVSPGVRAGFADDNREFGRYIGFLGKFIRRVPIWTDVGNRIVFSIVDARGKPASRARLVYYGRERGVLARRVAYADGRSMFFPSEKERFARSGTVVEISWAGEKKTLQLEPHGPKHVRVALDGLARIPERIPVDICFVLDTTGSMGDEAARLKATIEVVHDAVIHLDAKPDVRFGLVAYRDRGDEYVTRKTGFTGDVGAFMGKLNQVRVGGGGDAPEDLQEGLRVALKDLEWRDEAIGIVFVITDAPPQLFEDQEFTYIEAARYAASRGIKIVGIGASGLTVDGEAVLRQLAQYTMGQFVFLTYGETGESEGGTRTSVSHHTGANFRTRNLDSIIVRFVRQEIAGMRGEELADEDWLETDPREKDGREDVLDELFTRGIRRLLDFATVVPDAGTTTLVAPVAVRDEKLKRAAELLEHRLLLAVARHPAFKVVERRNLRQILEEHALGQTGVINEREAAKLGLVLGAELAVVSEITAGSPRHELLLKLIRVETTEVISVYPLRVSRELVE